VIKSLHSHCANPIVLPLSNPTSHVEALPSDIIRWTNGQALIATGSPFSPVNYQGKIHNISQCNNAYIFPGIGLGVISVHATRVTNRMMIASSAALADCSPKLHDSEADLLPNLDELQSVSKKIAFRVAKAAIEDAVAPAVSDEELLSRIEANFWQPEYRHYKRVSF
jgi:malate dehydrogenase (oxaloacetate-decarboxylating)